MPARPRRGAAAPGRPPRAFRTRGQRPQTPPCRRRAPARRPPAPALPPGHGLACRSWSIRVRGRFRPPARHFSTEPSGAQARPCRLCRTAAAAPVRLRPQSVARRCTKVTPRRQKSRRVARLWKMLDFPLVSTNDSGCPFPWTRSGLHGFRCRFSPSGLSAPPHLRVSLSGLLSETSFPFALSPCPRRL